MKKRNARVCYDKHFTALNGAKCEHDGRQVSGISLFFKYKYYVHPKNSETEIEVLFPEDGSIQPDCFFFCSYDKEKAYRMELNKDHFGHSLYSSVDYELEPEATIWYEDSNDGYKISAEAALCLLKSFPETFDHSNNVLAQNLAYYMNVSKEQ